MKITACKSTTPRTDEAVERIGNEPLEDFTKFHKLGEFAGSLESELSIERRACNLAGRDAERLAGEVDDLRSLLDEANRSGKYWSDQLTELRISHKQVSEERDCLAEGLRNIARLTNPANREPEDVATAHGIALRLTQEPEQQVYPKEPPIRCPSCGSEFVNGNGSKKCPKCFSHVPIPNDAEPE